MLPAPDSLEFSLPEGYVCLVTDDGGETTPHLVRSLAVKGWKLVVLSFPKSIVPEQKPLPEGIHRIELEDLNEEHLGQKLDQIAQEFGPIAAFIHMNPANLAPHDGTVSFSDVERAIVKLVFLAAKHLKESLNAASKKGRAMFFAVVRLDGEFGLALDASFEPISGGLFGLVKSLNLEWDSVFCRAVDLAPALSAEDSARYILDELYDPNRLIAEVAYGQQGRSTLVVEHVHPVR